LASSIEMTSNLLGQVCLATRTASHKMRRAKFVQREALGACRACNRMGQAIPVKKRPLLTAEIARPTAVDVSYSSTIELDSIVGRDYATAARARRLKRHLNTQEGETRQMPQGPTPVRVNRKPDGRRPRGYCLVEQNATRSSVDGRRGISRRIESEQAATDPAHLAPVRRPAQARVHRETSHRDWRVRPQRYKRSRRRRGVPEEPLQPARGVGEV
jgi:hypothetical protein